MNKRSEERDFDAGNWECVSGRFNQDFLTVEDELVREIKSELGENFNFKLIAPISFYHFYRSDKKEDELVGINYLCEYIDGEITLSEEHTDFKWIKPEDAISKLSMHPLLVKDIEHLIKIKDVYLMNKNTLVKNFKKSN